MEQLFWPDPRKLTSLHPEEPDAAQAREALAEMLARGLRPMHDYLACFKRRASPLGLGGRSAVHCCALLRIAAGAVRSGAASVGPAALAAADWMTLA